MLDYEEYAKTLPYKQLVKEYNYLTNAMRRFGDTTLSNKLLHARLAKEIEERKEIKRHV